MDENARQVLTAVALLRSQEKIDLLRSAFHELPCTSDLRLERLQEAAPHLVNGHAPDLLLVDVGSDDESDLEALTRFTQQNGQRTKVVATAERATVEHVRRLMRAGVVDFIPQPLNSSEVAAALRATLRDDQSRTSPVAVEKSSHLVALLHAAGGAGATTIGVECACAIARKTRGEVGFLDFDLQFGNAGLLLDLEADRSITTLLEYPNDIDASLLRKLCATHSSGLRLLPTSPAIIPLEALTPKVALQTITAAREIFPTVFVDLPLAWSDWTLSVLKSADVALFVTGLSVPELERASRLFRALAEQDLAGLEIRMIANRVPRFWAAERVTQAEKALGRRFAATIVRNDDAVREAQDRGISLADSGAGRISKGIQALAASIIDGVERGPRHATTVGRP